MNHTFIVWWEIVKILYAKRMDCFQCNYELMEFPKNSVFVYYLSYKRRYLSSMYIYIYTFVISSK